jgi:hypothetical protein
VDAAVSAQERLGIWLESHSAEELRSGCRSDPEKITGGVFATYTLEPNQFEIESGMSRMTPMVRIVDPYSE